MLKRLIIQSIETGSITALVMILLLISYETMGTKNATYVVWQVQVHLSFLIIRLTSAPGKYRLVLCEPCSCLSSSPLY